MTKAPKTKRLPKKELEAQLDRALEQTFPASDAVTVGEPTSTAPDRPLHRQPAKIDKALVDALAEKVAEKHSDRK